MLECARTRLTAAHVERIEHLLGPDINWAAVLHFTEESALVPLVYENLRKVASHVPLLVPEIWMNRLEKSYRANIVRALYQTADLTKILQVLESRGLFVIAYKGPVLAAQAYGDPASRQFYDLDIVVAQKDLPAVDEVLRSLDFQGRFAWPRVANPAATQTPGEYTYKGGHSQILLEVHTERTMRHFPVPLDLSVFASRLTKISLAGRQVQTFCPEDALPILCVHGAKDFWSRASNIVDIAELVQLQPFDWNVAHSTARELRCKAMMLLGLSLAEQLIGVALPISITEEIYANAKVIALTHEIVRRFSTDGRHRWNAISRSLYRARLTDPETSSLAYLWRLGISPAEDAWWPGNRSVVGSALHSLLSQAIRSTAGKSKSPFGS